MHWFFRAAIAVAVGVLYGVVYLTVRTELARRAAQRRRDRRVRLRLLRAYVGRIFGLYLPIAVLTLAIWSLLAKLVGR